MEQRKIISRVAMFYGLLLGAYYIVRFLSMVMGFKMEIMAVAFLFLTLALPFLAYRLIAQSVKKYFDFPLSFLQLLFYCINVFIYSSLLLMLIEYLYYGYIAPESLKAQFSYSLETLKSLETTKQLVDQMGDTSLPSLWNYIFSNFSMNVTIGMLLSIPIAFLIFRKKRNNKI